MADGRESDFEMVFRAHFDAVYGYVAFRLSPAIDDASDLTQEVFVAALKAWENFRGDSTPLCWLRSIARRKIVDYFKHRPTEVSFDMTLVSAEMTPNEGVSSNATLLAAALRLIPSDYVELLEEKYLDGLSVREIAQRHGKSEKAIESALSRARAMVREKSQQQAAICGDLS